ncbi:MAG: response regulator [Bacteroidales bacterium]
MKIKNLKISTQLKIGLGIMLFLVFALGAVSYIQTNNIHQQTEKLYNHPLQVRRAIGSFRAEIISIHRDMKDLFLSESEKEIANDLNQMETSKALAFEHIEILYRQFLGSHSDIDSLKQAFVVWNSIREETIRMFREGKIREAANRTQNNGLGGSQVDLLLSKLQKIDNFARNKGDELYKNSIDLKGSLNNQLILFVSIILLLIFIVNFILIRNIRTPIQELSNTIENFQKGDISARSSYFSKNEFGELSASFNEMLAFIQVNTDLDKKFVKLSSVMMSEYDAKKFFKTTLNAIANETDAQMAAVYLLAEDGKTYEHFESVGLNEEARLSFSAGNNDGEFGAVLSLRKLQHIKNIPKETRFLFYTVSGMFIPNEMISIPVISGNRVIAVISLASLKSFTEESVQLIEDITDTLNSRIEGILAYRMIKDFSKKMELQNRELETQKTELSSQSAELMEQNTELEMQKMQLNEANRLKTNFLSNMSHELRTPLNSVIALSGVLNRRLANKIPEEEYSYIDVIERNGKHLLELINDILDISRIESGREEMEITKFNANSLISEVVSMIRPQVKQKNVDLIHAENDTELFFTSDMGKCRHILQNIIANAIKFTEKGKVEVTARKTENKLLITITDTGIGIDEDHIVHIFDEFRQADGSTSRKYGGSGLGLAIAKKYANLLGGNITVKSELGIGTEFTLTLPLRYAVENRIVEVEAITKFSPAPKRIIQKQSVKETVKTILLVEDSDAAIIQLNDFLEESGYQILIARDGGEALDIISQSIPDAIILDLMMPGIDGFEVLKTLRETESTANVPVLILTAKHITKEDLSSLTRNNINQLIQKGDINRNELLNEVNKMVFPETKTEKQPQRELQNIEGKAVILVVEDNPDNMTTVKALLSDDYVIIEAVDGKQAIETVKQQDTNLILMDIALPEVDGIEAFKTIRGNVNFQHIPIIALTASAMTSDREIILSHGFDAYIAKPIDQKLFFTTINEVLYGQ